MKTEFQEVMDYVLDMFEKTIKERIKESLSGKVIWRGLEIKFTKKEG